MSGANQLTNEVDIDISGLLKEVWKKLWLILAIASIFAVVVFFASSAISPRYKTSASILIERNNSFFARKANDMGLNSELDQDAVGSQVQLLQSDKIALAVINKLNLTKNSEFSSDASLSFMEMIFGKDRNAPSAQERILQEYYERLQVYNAANSRMIKIEFWATNPALARDVANAIAQEYKALKEKEKFSANDEAKDFLKPEIAQLQRDVDMAHKQVTEFRNSQDLAMSTNNAYLATQQLSEVSSELSRVKAERSSVEATAASIRNALSNGISMDAIPDVISNPLIQRLLERQVTLKAQISELSTSLLPNHPKLKALKSQVADYDTQIRRTAKNILSSMESNVAIVRQRERELATEVTRLKGEAARVGDAEVELNALQLELDNKRKQLEKSQENLGDISSGAAINSTPINIEVIGASIPPEHYFPKVIPFTIAAFVVAFILSVVGVLAWALLSGKAFKPVGQIAPGMMPEAVAVNEPNLVDHPNYALEQADIRNGPRRVASPSMMTPMMGQGAQQAQLYSNQDLFAPVAAVDLLQVLLNYNGGRIACVSPGGEAGSNVTIDIARTLSQEGKKVVLVDMSGKATATNTMLGTNQVPGVFEIISGSQTVDNVLYADNESNTHVVGVGMEQKPADALSMPRLKEMVATLEDNYDFVLVDCGVVDIRSLLKFGDSKTMVIINSEGAALEHCRDLEAQANGLGIEETVTIAPMNESPFMSFDNRVAA